MLDFYLYSYVFWITSSFKSSLVGAGLILCGITSPDELVVCMHWFFFPPTTWERSDQQYVWSCSCAWKFLLGPKPVTFMNKFVVHIRTLESLSIVWNEILHLFVYDTRHSVKLKKGSNGSSGDQTASNKEHLLVSHIHRKYDPTDTTYHKDHQCCRSSESASDCVCDFKGSWKHIYVYGPV